MKYLIFTAIACGVAFSGYGQLNNSFDAKDRNAIRKVASKWELAWNTHDMNALSTLFADDVDFVTKSGNWLKGKEATMEHHRKNHATIFANSKLMTESVDIKFVRTDLTIAHIRWAISGDTHHDGTTSNPRHGVSTWVLVKRSSQWLLLAVQNANIEPPQ
jgi:uncharacterized protein (TIGR02246 family)